MFPENSLATSFVVTVWLGVSILCFFNRRFGWAMSGLVVPGILAPTLMAKPVIGALIVLEAILIYGAVRLVTALLPRVFFSSELFGRDRFFAMLLLSVPVRIAVETILAPAFLPPGVYDSAGIGLVIAPLLANQLWKPGLVRGLGASLIVVSLTAAVIHFVLVPFTNFDFNNLSLVLDSLSSRLEDSPKAYIVLLTTAFIASHLNLRFGWDFGGILFPALLALALFDPLQLAATLAEAVFLYFVGKLVLELPWIKARGIEGASRTWLFFNLAFLYRFLLGYVMQWLLPTSPGYDFLAVGYLISTILAMRAEGKHTGIRLVRSVGQVAIVGAAAGLALSLAFNYWQQGLPGESRGIGIAVAKPTEELSPSRVNECRPNALAERLPLKPGIMHMSFSAYLRQRVAATPTMLARSHSESYAPFSAIDRRRMRNEVLVPLRQLAARSWNGQLKVDGDELEKLIAPINRVAHQLGYHVDILAHDEKQHSLLLSEAREAGFCHRGLLVLALGEQRIPLTLLVNRPLQEARALESGSWLFDHLNARALLMPTAHPEANWDGSADVNRYANRQSFFVATLEELVRAAGDEPMGFVEIKAWDAPETIATDLIMAHGDVAVPYHERREIPAVFLKMAAEHGLELRFKDGSEEMLNAAPPSLVLQSVAGRGAATSAWSLSVNPRASRFLTPVVGKASWEAQWLRFGRQIVKADVRRELGAYGKLTEELRKEIRALLQDQSFARLMRIEQHWPDVSLQLVEDRASDAIFLVATSSRRAARELFQMHGKWQPRRISLR